jgi:hypothetical protein
MFNAFPLFLPVVYFFKVSSGALGEILDTAVYPPLPKNHVTHLENEHRETFS